MNFVNSFFNASKRFTMLALYCKSPTLRMNPPLIVESTMFINSTFNGVKVEAFLSTSFCKSSVRATAVVTFAATFLWFLSNKSIYWCAIPPRIPSRPFWDSRSKKPLSIFEALEKISSMIFLFCELGRIGLFNASYNSGRLSII